VKTEDLVADGPYRHTRNPLYLANILLAIGMGALMSRIGFVVAVLLMVVFSYRLILREETELRSNQGERYERYATAVPSLAFALTKNSLRRTPAELERWIQSRIMVLGIRRIQRCVRDNFEPESVLRDIWS